MNNNYFNPTTTAADNVLARQQAMQLSQIAQIPQQMQMQAQAPQQMFIQPSGNVYQLNSSSDIDMVPVGNQMVSVGFCFNEGIIQFKTLQNGIPMVVAYQMTPIDAKELAAKKAASQNAATSLENRIAKIEQLLSNQNKKEGADLSWQI